MKSRAASRFLFSAVFAVLLATSSSAFAQVLKVVLNDTINPVTDEFLGRALDQAKAVKAQAVLIEINTPGGLVDSTRGIIEKILCFPDPNHRLRHPERQPFRLGRIFHPRGCRRRRHGARHQYRRGASGHGRWRKNGRRDESQGRERSRRFHALNRRQAGTQRPGGRERSSRIEVFHRAGSARQAPGRLHRPYRTGPVSPDCGEAHSPLRWHDHHARPHQASVAPST